MWTIKSVIMKIVFRVSFSNGPDFSAECQQFIFYYIDLVHSNKNAIPNMYYLPPKMLLVMFLRRRKDIPEVSIFLVLQKNNVFFSRHPSFCDAWTRFTKFTTSPGIFCLEVSEISVFFSVSNKFLIRSGRSLPDN